MSQFTWVVKASKLCNMRCSYCYEFDELGNRERMSFETWEDVFVSLAETMGAAEARQREYAPDTPPRPSRGLIVIHGGEPSLLPTDYLETVFAMRERLLGPDFPIDFALQSNLLSVSDEFIALLKRWKVKVGFSFDVVPGVRVSVGGRETEARVVANLDRMMDADIVSGGIAVIAKHTSREIPRVYRFFAERKLWMRALPLFQGAPESLSYAYEVPNDAIISALCQLFDLWLEDGAPITVEPLTGYLRVAVLKLIGARGRVFDPTGVGYPVYHVNTNGDLYHVPESYVPEKCLGNVRERSVSKLLTTARYDESVKRTCTILAKHCTDCRYAGPCHGEPLLNSSQPGDFEGRCAVGYPVLDYIERRLREVGMTRGELLGILGNVAGEQRPELVAS